MIWDQLPTIKASRVSLRLLTEADVDGLYSIFSHPEVMRYWSTPPLANRDAAVELLKGIQDSFARQTMLKWGVARNEDNVLLGTATLFNLSFENGRAEIGYGLGRPYWGSGYMNEALQVLIEYSFKELNLRRLEADADPRNIKSLRTLERLGFQREGYLRERWHVAGEIQDTVFFGLLRREWKFQ
jgi:RimJ/RimL family protein N-acetyltransferase